jgi:plastocyanin domain-containing protein
MDIVINLVALLLIAGIIWWFWLYKPAAVQQASDVVDILVDNGVYEPANIKVQQGKPVTLKFLRKDASPCAEKVIFDKLNLSVDLPVGEPVEVKIQPEQAGEIEFTCQMQMYRGRLLVE